MKNQRTLLIEQAARGDAEEGTEWRDRTERWLDVNRPQNNLNSEALLDAVIKATGCPANWLIA